MNHSSPGLDHILVAYSHRGGLHAEMGNAPPLHVTNSAILWNGFPDEFHVPVCELVSNVPFRSSLELVGARRRELARHFAQECEAGTRAVRLRQAGFSCRSVPN